MNRLSSLGKRFLLSLLLMAGLCPGTGAVTFNYVPIDYRGVFDTRVSGIDGRNLVGTFRDAGGRYHGFLYDGSTWTVIDYPGARNTYACGINNGKIVGWYYDGNHTHGLVATPLLTLAMLSPTKWNQGPQVLNSPAPSHPLTLNLTKTWQLPAKPTNTILLQGRIVPVC